MSDRAPPAAGRLLALKAGGSQFTSSNVDTLQTSTADLDHFPGTLHGYVRIARQVRTCSL